MYVNHAGLELWFLHILKLHLFVGSILHGGRIELFFVPAHLHDWCNKGRGMCYPVCGMMHIIIKNPYC